MRKTIILSASLLIFLFGLTIEPNTADAETGFTCCPQEKSDCIYQGEMVGQDKYYNGSGPCIGL